METPGIFLLSGTIIVILSDFHEHELGVER